MPRLDREHHSRQLHRHRQGGHARAGQLPVGRPDRFGPGNTVGGTSAATRNLISANHWGVTIIGATAVSNLVHGQLHRHRHHRQAAAGQRDRRRADHRGGVEQFDRRYVDRRRGTRSRSTSTMGSTSAPVPARRRTGAQATRSSRTRSSATARWASTSPATPATRAVPGPNNLQSFPVLQSVNPGSSSTTIQGRSSRPPVRIS